MLLNAVVICLAACVGALLRWGFALWLNPGGVLPWGTLAVNLICLLYTSPSPRDS